MPENIFITAERRVWMRRCDHTVVFDRDPHFERCVADSGGSVLRILRIWVAPRGSGAMEERHYVGSIRHWEGGGAMSHRELRRLYRRAALAAGYVQENVRSFRGRLTRLLREQFS